MVKSIAMTDRGTSALKAHMNGCDKVEMRQTRRGCLQELCGCEAKTEFKYFIGGTQVFHSLEDAGCCCRCWCQPCHPYVMTVKELNTEAEIVTVDRPFRCCACSCKCCCRQEATFSSGGQTLGKARESFYWCVPQFKIFDDSGNEMYRVAPPTCCGGCCVNCCAEGNPCGKGCCKESYRIYNPDTHDVDAHVGLILKKPKSAATEVFTDADAFVVDFPKDASADKKGMLLGMGILINSIFYEGGNNSNSDA